MRTRITTATALTAAALALSTLSAPAAQAAGAPEVGDTWATAVLSAGLDVHALVDPNEAETRAKAEYLTAAAYEANLKGAKDPFAGAISSPIAGNAVGSGDAPVAYLRHIGGLKAATAYRYRVVATSVEGTVPGPIRSFTTQESNSAAFALPDGRGWELVSPLDKNGGEIQAAGGNFDGGVLQAAADGTSVTYTSSSSFAGGQGAPGASQYISRRAPEGWSTQNITAPTLSGSYGAHPDGVPYQLFSGDLGRVLLVIPQRCDTAPCLRGYDLRQSANGALSASPEASDLAFAGSSADLSQVVLSSCAALTANATEAPGVGGCDPSKANLYRWAGGALTLINFLPGENTGTPGAALGAQSNAISADGSRAYFTLGGNLYLRAGTQTVQVDDAQGGGGTFETATADGSIAFFTKAGHLYRYVAATDTATDLTPAGEVQGVLGASPDGSYLYYLTTAGLFLHRNGVSSKVAAGADATNYPPTTGTVRITANGNLAFLSSVALTDSDTGGFSEVYLYAPASGVLTCVSCNPTGGRPIGPSTIPGAVANGKGAAATKAYKPRALSANGNRLFFDSQDALVITDTNNDSDVYQWEAPGVGSCAKPGGCVALISSGRATEGATFLDASSDGNDAFFLTDGSLVPNDPGVVDVYDAKVGGGLPVPQAPIACVGDACQVVPGEPEDPTPGTGFYRPEGNPAPSYPKVKKHKKHKAKKHHKKKTKSNHKPGKAKKGGKR